MDILFINFWGIWEILSERNKDFIRQNILFIKQSRTNKLEYMPILLMI